MFPAPIQHCKL